jgi:hypothetical protein
MTNPLFNFGPKQNIPDTFIEGMYEDKDPGVYYVDEENEAVYARGENDCWLKRLVAEDMEENLHEE